MRPNLNFAGNAADVLAHYQTALGGDLDVMDAPPGRESEVGGNVAIAIDVDDEGRAARVFAKLAEDGDVLMPFEETFFARKFGMTSDKFGVRWMVSVAPIALTPS